jgi:hypothetical protein
VTVQQTSTKRIAIVAYRRQNPYATQTEIGQAIGLSRERVRQLLKKMGLPAVVKDPAKIPNYFCDSCGELIYAERQARSKYKFCNRECYHASRVLTIECFVCGELFLMQLSQWIARVRRNNTLTCSMACRGVTIGRQVKAVRAKKYWSPIKSMKIRRNKRLTLIDTCAKISV